MCYTNAKIEKVVVMRSEILKDCILCPRECHVDRTKGEKGACHAADKIRSARAGLHMWEEPCLSGEKGSGTVFFSGCSLGCVFCQNQEIARGKKGIEISVMRLAEIFLELQEKEAANINLVTGEHYVPQILDALDLAKKGGLLIPVVYNSSGYEKVETLRMLEGYVDVYLPDFKYWDNELAKKYSKVSDYRERAIEAVAEMVRQAGEPKFTDEGYLKKGVIVRHLVLPGNIKNTKAVLQYLYETYQNQIYLSIMSQYTPMPEMNRFPELNRKVTRREYDKVLNFAVELGIENGFFQEGEVASESFIPAFDGEGILKKEEKNLQEFQVDISDKE